MQILAHCHLRPDQMAALSAYAAEHGRTWKAQLRDDWMNSRTTGALQELRNTHGPSWLSSFRLER
jgi:hypothetical protein